MNFTVYLGEEAKIWLFVNKWGKTVARNIIMSDQTTQLDGEESCPLEKL